VFPSDYPYQIRVYPCLSVAFISLDSLRAFDFFPNTPHVETLAVFLGSAVGGHG